jgi:hypothetical protein
MADPQGFPTVPISPPPVTTRWRRWLWRALAAAGLTFVISGAITVPLADAPPPVVQAAGPHAWAVPTVRWYPVTLGPPALYHEGTQISSVLMGPHQLIYYGTDNPLGDANIIGWLNPQTGANRWAAVPPVDPPFPAGSNWSSLNWRQSAAWGAVTLLVSGAHTVWYRFWGYVGGWKGTAGRFVPGLYRIEGATVHRGPWTVSLHTNFQGTSHLVVAGPRRGLVTRLALPGQSPYNAVVVSNQPRPMLWLLTDASVYRCALPSGSWQPVATLGAGDFYVAMGRWHRDIWVVDAEGHIGLVRSAGGVQWLSQLDRAPLMAVSAGSGKLWIITRHHLVWWQQHGPSRQWPLPSLAYPAPARDWPSDGPQEPPNWPPIAHIAEGPRHGAVIGYGNWIGVAGWTPRNGPG